MAETPDSSAELVRSEVSQGIATVWLNRPDRGNGWSPALEDELAEHLLRAAGDEAVRVIVVTGAGKAFCVGGDMSMLTDYSGRVAGPVQRLVPRIPKPVIAAINGACAGVGLAFALSCDMRFAAEGVRFATSFSRVGVGAEYGLTWYLPRMVGMGRAFDLIVSGRPFTSEKAYEYGIVEELHPADRVLKAARDYAADLVARVSPYSMAMCKRQLVGDHSRGLDAALDEANHIAAEAITLPDFAEGVASFTDRRPPAFAPWRGGLFEDSPPR